MNLYAIKLLALGDQELDPPEWVTNYDPDYGEPPRVGLIDSSPNPDNRVTFTSFKACYAYLMRESKKMPTRLDGKPNRPITMFTLQIERIDDDPRDVDESVS